MAVTIFEVRPGAYYDSVVLMHLQRALAGLEVVIDAGVVMATPANLELLADASLLPDDHPAGPDDLLIVVKAASEDDAQVGLQAVDKLMAARRSVVPATAYKPRSLDGAARSMPDAKWVLVSVPGRYAADVTREALNLGRHVFLYSDNVSLEDEIALKREAVMKGLLVMGPDCGTAIVNGVGLGFANRVRRGSIGLVGASGTGLQAVTSHIHALGGGVSHAIGTGGRDLKASVGGLTARQGISLLARDPATRVIVLVSKPPDPALAAELLALAGSSGKPVVVNFIGYPAPAHQLGNLHFATNLTDAARLAVELASADTAPDASESLVNGERKYLRGLFSGGTLAYEALRGLEVMLSPLYSNVPVHESQKIPDPLTSQFHTLLDLGEDVFTVGRLHPMMDNDLRLRRIEKEAADPQVALLLLDVVLGEGAHPDPAGELAPAIAQAVQTHGVEVVAILVGTDEDPQDLDGQREKLVEAGAKVFEDTLQAVAYGGGRLAAVPVDDNPPVSLDDLNAPLAGINVGIETFYESLTAQDAQVVQVDWRPPAGGDENLMSILAKMRS